MSETLRRELLEIRFDVAAHRDGWRLDQFVQACIPRLSRTRIQRMIRAQRSLGGDDLWPSTRVRDGQSIRLLRPAPDEPDVPRYYHPLYEDDLLLVIGKPAGLPVHATARFHRNTLTHLLGEKFPTDRVPRLVHRIDRETSGAMLLARDRGTEAALKAALAARQVRKTYLAIVHGQPDGDGRIDLPIGADVESGIRVKRTVCREGLPARTRFRTVGRRGQFALVEANPETGRQHQIRVHLAAIGHPIVGDKLYGGDPGCLFEYLETGWTDRLATQLILPRHALHAAAVHFTHPGSGESMCVECPLEADLRAFWDGLAGA